MLVGDFSALGEFPEFPMFQNSLVLGCIIQLRRCLGQTNVLVNVMITTSFTTGDMRS